MNGAVSDTAYAAKLFEGCDAVIVQACLEGTMGHLLVDRAPSVPAAAAVLGDFAYLAGNPCKALLGRILQADAPAPQILIPCSDATARLLEAHVGNGFERHTRYAMQLEPSALDLPHLCELASAPDGVTIRSIDQMLYRRCLELPWSLDLVSQFPTFARFDARALGFIALEDGAVVSGASTYARSADAIEIEVDTAPAARRRGLACACAAALILACHERGIRPNWDAHTAASRTLAESLGYRLARAYTAYIVQGA